MNIVFRLFLSTLFFQPATSFACIGDGSSYAVGFRKHHVGDGLVATLTDKKTGAVREVVDDTGAVSIQLAMAKLSDGLSGGNIDLNKEQAMVKFMLSRLDKYKAVLVAADPGATAEAVVKIDQLAALLKNGGVQPFLNLRATHAEISQSLFKNGIQVTAAVKENGMRSFGAEQALNQLDLPSPVKSRSSGCNTAVASFSTAVGQSESPSESLPTFDIGSGVN